MKPKVKQYLHFEEEKVIVEVPSDDIRVIRTKLNLKTVNFQLAYDINPFRVVINIEIQQKNEYEEFETITDENPLKDPITLWVHYTYQDYIDADKRLKLACWNGTQWIEFTSQKYNLQFFPEAAPESGGWAKVDLLGWSDPAIVWAD